MSFDSPALLSILAVILVVSFGIRVAVSLERRRVKPRTSRLLDVLRTNGVMHASSHEERPVSASEIDASVPADVSAR